MWEMRAIDSERWNGDDSRMNGADILSSFRQDIDTEVARQFPVAAGEVQEMLRYQLGFSEDGRPSTGKGLRPSLTLLACEALGGDIQRALPVAVAIEMVHNFSLIHDDIEDNDEMRHHRATLWRVYGRDKAIAGGLALWSRAYSILLSCVDEALPAARVLEARQILNDACQEMIEGQHQDISFEQRLDVTLPEYIEMIGGKTAALISASIQIGAVLAGASKGEVEKFAAFGREMGLAFQIRDDILGIWGEGSATGKPVGADIGRKKKTLPIVQAFQQTVGVDHETLHRVYSQAVVHETDIDSVLDILQRWNSRYFAQGLAEDYRSRAMAALSTTKIAPEARIKFDELMSFVLQRDY